MKFVKQQPDSAAEYLSQTIGSYLKSGKKVLWLLSGGSSVSIALKTRKLLEGQNLDQLTITLVDERYGPDGHADSNWNQLEEAGFDFSGIKALPVLQNLPVKETTALFAENLGKQLSAADIKIGLLGIGADGHTSGLLPDCSALDSTELAAYYQGPDYLRITTTPTAIKMLNEAVVSLSGEQKKPLIERLQADESVKTMPAQILKSIPRVTIFNDWIGE